MANRVAEERGALLGHEVGYTIRFDDCSDPHATRIKVARGRWLQSVLCVASVGLY